MLFLLFLALAGTIVALFRLNTQIKHLSTEVRDLKRWVKVSAPAPNAEQSFSLPNHSTDHLEEPLNDETPITPVIDKRELVHVIRHPSPLQMPAFLQKKALCNRVLHWADLKSSPH